MAIIYFGLPPRDRGATELAVKTEQGEYEPTEPSRLKIFVSKPLIPLWSILTSTIGLFVSIFSYPRYTYVPLLSPGLAPHPPSDYLPFLLPGLAVPIKKGRVASERLSSILLADCFTSMHFQGRVVWLVEEGSKEILLRILDFDEVDHRGATPERYLNPQAFQALLSLLSLSTWICSFLHSLCGISGDLDVTSSFLKPSKMGEGWVSAEQYQKDGQLAMETDKRKNEFTKAEAFTSATYENFDSFFLHTGSAKAGMSSANSLAAYNDRPLPVESFIESGNSSKIVSNGHIVKFNEQLAKPDINLVGDVLGRYFMLLLGDSTKEQFDNLAFIKTGIAQLRLTRLGSELTHLYRCIDLALQSDTGLVPFFTGKSYEGCVLQGGANSTSLLLGAVHLEKSDKTDLKAAFLTVSDHASALNFIMQLLVPGYVMGQSVLPASMYDLRILCLNSKLSKDEEDAITRRAAQLDFNSRPWPITPAKLAHCFQLISGDLTLNSTIPVGRLALFSKDMVIVALSCFGEKSCPSWDTPNGTKNSLKALNPPAPPANAPGRRPRSGVTSDAGWVMTVRRTDLMSAADDFKDMARELCFRSVASTVARKSGHFVFQRDRMVEFWLPMRKALKVVNPDAAFETDDGSSTGSKRPASDSPSTVRGMSTPVKRIRF